MKRYNLYICRRAFSCIFSILFVSPILQKCHIIRVQQCMKCDNIKLCKINILVSTLGTFDNRDKALICLPALLHNNVMWWLKLSSTSIFAPNNFTFDTHWIVTLWFNCKVLGCCSLSKIINWNFSGFACILYKCIIVLAADNKSL